MARTKTFDEKEVLLKAMSVFWEKGYHATSIQDLVESLGINRASLYDTYGGKSQLFHQAVSIYQKTNQERIRNFLFQHDNIREGIRLLFYETIRQNFEDPLRKGCFVVNTSTELGASDPDSALLLRQNQETVVGVFEEYLKSGIEKGQLESSADTRQIAVFLYAVNSGIMVLAKTAQEKKSLESTIDTALSVLSRPNG